MKQTKMVMKLRVSCFFKLFYFSHMFRTQRSNRRKKEDDWYRNCKVLRKRTTRSGEGGRMFSPKIISEKKNGTCAMARDRRGTLTLTF